MGKDHGDIQGFSEQGRAAGKFAYKLTFKLFQIIFNDLPKVFRIDEYIKNNL
jgi:hypothetical protein